MTPLTSVTRRTRVIAALTALVLLLTGYTAWTLNRPVRLTASLEMEATPQEVWDVLTGFSAYPEWNPFMTSAEVTSPPGARGRPTEGARLRVVMHDAAGDTTFTPTLLTVSPGRELRWLGRLGPGWIADGEHRFVIERSGPGRVRLTQSEEFTGVAVPFAAGMLRSDTLPQFRAMNTALAERIAARREG